MHNKIITIGHASHDISRFVELLEANQVETLIDTRQFPVSRHNPSFNRSKISKWLPNEGFQYVFLGNGLGNIQERILNTSIRLEEINSNSPEFRAFSHDFGNLLAHLNSLENIAILGVRGDPFESPRFYQLAPLLQGMGFSINHVLEDGQVIPNWQLEVEMVRNSINCELTSSLHSKQILQLAYQTHRMVIANKNKANKKASLKGPPNTIDLQDHSRQLPFLDLVG